MAKKGLFGKLLTATAAIAAVGGACYMFRDKIKESKLYEELGVEDKLHSLKNMRKNHEDEEDFIDEDEYIFEDLEPSDEDMNRTYVSLNTEPASSKESEDDDDTGSSTESEDEDNEAAERDNSPADDNASALEATQADDNTSAFETAQADDNTSEDESASVPTISYDTAEDMDSASEYIFTDTETKDDVQEVPDNSDKVKGETPSGYDMEGLSDVSEDPDVLIEQDLLDEAPYDI